MDTELLFKQLYKSSLRYLGIRLRSEHEIRLKLKEWLKRSFPEASGKEEVLSEIEERVVAQLKKDRFLDDYRFAAEWVGSRMRNKPRGEMLLRMELVQKGIERNIIDEVLNELLHQSPRDEDENTGLLQMATKVGQKYLNKLKTDDNAELRFKLTQALARKGFEMRTIRSVVDELISKRYNTRE